MPALTIGEVAKAAGVGVETVRFYERKGLIPDPPRRPSGYRAYPEGVVDRIVTIRHAEACDERSPTSECPILGAIEQGGSR